MGRVWLLLICACGRIGFDGSTAGDASSDGAIVDTAVIDGVPRPCLGLAWCAETSGVGDDLAAVWGASPHELWAVGGGGTIVRRTAAGWGRIASDTSADLVAIGGSSAQDVWALGAGLGTYWNGTQWTQRAAPVTQVLGLWSFAPDDVWAVGDQVSHWDGAGWTVVPTPTPAITFYAVWGASPTNVIAVGAAGTILRWNGSAWTQMISNTDRELFAIHGRAANDIWASGSFGALQHFDGTTWSSATNPVTRELYGVQVLGANNAWVTGGGGTVLHWNGAAWAQVASGTTRFLAGIWAHSEAELWVVGAVGTIQRGP